MRDRIALQIGNQRIEDFLSYRVESSLFVADDAFEVSLVNRDVTVSAGDPVKLYVNDVLELTGIIDTKALGYKKQGTTLTLKGRDLMGLLTDAYIEEFVTLQDYTLKQLAEKLLAPIPYINRSAIIYGQGDKNRAVPLTKAEEDYDYQQLEPGKTIFDTLREYALSLGMLFFALPDGTFVFGQPITSGQAVFSLINKKNDPHSNILEGEITDDISRRYSRVIVMEQSQGMDEYGVDDINKSATVADATFPPGIYKPFVAEAMYDGQNLKKYAQILMDKYRFEGFSLDYKTYGHSHINGKNYTVNAICHVEDELLDIAGDFLVYERIFEMDKQAGATTSMKLSRLGILPE